MKSDKEYEEYSLDEKWERKYDELIKSGAEKQEEIAESLYNFNTLLVGISEGTIDYEKGIGRPAAYTNMEPRYKGMVYINIFTNVKAAKNWQDHFGRHLGVLNKDDNFGDLFTIGPLCGINTIWVNEGSESGFFLNALHMKKISGDSKMLFASVDKDTDISNGLAIQPNFYQVIVIEEEQ